MSSKSKVLIALVVISLLLAGCSSLRNTIAKVSPKKVEKNVLSGRDGSNGPVLVAKVDDTNEAHPQIGLEDADVVYIEQVEGGLTRLAAVFSSTIPTQVGPVRSARISDIDILSQYGHVAFAYSGAQKKFLPVIAAANVQNLGAQSQSPTIYTTDPTRNPPYAMVLRADLLMQKTVTENYLIEKAKSVGWKFSPAPVGGKPTSSVTLHWPAASYKAEWSESQKRWLLLHNSTLDLAQSGKTLGPTTLVIQMVSITPSQYHDKVGGVTPFSNTVGSGSGYLLRDGKAIEIKWQRPVATAGTIWTLSDGSIANFADGQVWIALTDHEPTFERPAVIEATPSPSSK